MTIDPWSSSDVTVVYNSVEQKPFEATMHIYSNDPDQRMRDVKVKGSRYAPNFLTFETHDVLAEHHLAIVVSADTYDRIELFSSMWSILPVNTNRMMETIRWSHALQA